MYPGAGDTYISVLLKDIYGISLQPFKKTTFSENENRDVFFKTSLLPNELFFDLQKSKVIYLVRDGRDCVLNAAHFRKNSVDTSTDVHSNLTESIVASKGSYYGGWSKHVDLWTDQADLIVRFEDLIVDPLAQIERIRKFVILPVPDKQKIVPYNDQLHGDYISSESRHALIKKGVPIPSVSRWQDEMTSMQQEMFYKYHQDALIKLGYYKVPELNNLDLDFYFYPTRSKLMDPVSYSVKPYRVLLEASKLQMLFNDGIKRYVFDLAKEIKKLAHNNPYWEIYLFDGGSTYPIDEVQLERFLERTKIEISRVKKIKSFIVANIKTVLKAFLSVNGYQQLGLQYKSTKAAIRFSSFNQNIRKMLVFVETKVFSKRIKLVSSQVKFDAADFDLVHIPLLQHVEYISKAKDKVLMTLHDLTHISHPEFHQQDNIILADLGFKLCVEQHAEFLAISHSTQKDLLKELPELKDVQVIHEAAENDKFCPLYSEYWKTHIRASFGLPTNARFILSVSTLEPRKNLKNAILAFQDCIDELPEDVYFIIVGKEGWKMQEVLPSSLVLSNRIIFTGFVKEEFLPWLYREALALIYVSHYEGFGLPLLEAMSSGTPVIFGNNSSMPEIVFDSGYPVNAERVEEISEAIRKVINDPIELKKKSVEALAQSNNFTWQRTAILTMSLYKKIIDERRERNEIKSNQILNETVTL